MQINDFLGKDAVSGPSRHPLLTTLAVIVFAEALLLAVTALWLIVELLVDEPSSIASALALTALVTLAAVWLSIVGANTLRGAPWVRSAIVVWQILQIAIGIGFLSYFDRPEIAWVLIAVAVFALVLVFTRPVMAATVRE
ncbi:hypothetical protein HDC94_002642 [Leifsonia sp. AK011]|uniref:hypothetical protein n=1 Tax=Leifsonia sp. AK011 TaxID=2723075 RepID=UPI0015C9E58E|nr:hypothetical protein [Leifsonia sp. AK011]NYF11486.1 hypothetical protein [Leifsonia sp. AK011]